MAFKGTFPATELTPAPCGLLGVADVTVHAARATDERWVRNYNATFETSPEKVSIVSAEGNDTVIYEDADKTSIQFIEGIHPFGIEIEDNQSGLGLTGDDTFARAKRQLEAVTQKAVEYELWEGSAAKADSTDTPYLAQSVADGGVEILTSGGVAAQRALALLEGAIANSPTGGGGVIHMTRDVAATIIGGGLSYTADELGGGKIITSLGTPVVVGSGYTGNGPEGEAGAAASDTNKWMYVTGPVSVHLTESEVVNDGFGQGFNSATNDIIVKADRIASVYFDPSIYAAAQVTLS